ncbi:DEAD box ATP-dependent RNA helicase, putative [Plasmodium sp. gorilla clade G1]|nr:DEAD box ATP-dependent RNA helicase, putative [Plasmodium sp. gorilla clade G1]
MLCASKIKHDEKSYRNIFSYIFQKIKRKRKQNNYVFTKNIINDVLCIRDSIKKDEIEEEEEEKKKKIIEEKEGTFLINLVNEKNKIIYDNIKDLNKYCIDKFKKYKCDVYISTSSNREYVPYYIYDFFINYPLLKWYITNKTTHKISDNYMNSNRCISSNYHMCRKKKKKYNNFRECKRVYYIQKNIKRYSMNNLFDNKNNICKYLILKKKRLEANNLFNLIKYYNVHKKELFLSSLEHKKLDNINFDSYIKLSLIKNFNVKYLTTVQYVTFPLFLKNYDLLISSFKSSGKTLAYMNCLVHKIIIQINNLRKKTNIKDNYVLGLIICPNVILVEQSYGILKKLIMYHPYNIICYYMHGKKYINIQDEIKNLKKKRPHIIITTPGYLINFIKYFKNFSQIFFLCDTLIIDEAHFLVDNNYMKNILIIKNILPKSHQTILLTCIVNNFLKNLAYRFLRLHYIHINLINNCIYDHEQLLDPSINQQYQETNKNIIKNIQHITNNINHMNKSKYQLIVQNGFKRLINFNLQLYNELNNKHIYPPNNILFYDNIGKLWYPKEANIFFQNVQSQYNLDNDNITLEEKKKNKNKIIIKKNKIIIKKNNIIIKKNNNNNISNNNNNNVDINDDTQIYDSSKESNYILPFSKNEMKIKKLKLSNSDYNRYHCSHHNKNDNKYIPTHVLLKQEYLIYESNKLSLILFNILHNELITNNNINIVIFMPTVKILQFFYVIYKHYIFKGYIFLLYLKLKKIKWKHPQDIKSYLANHSTYYDKDTVNFTVSSNPYIITNDSTIYQNFNVIHSYDHSVNTNHIIKNDEFTIKRNGEVTIKKNDDVTIKKNDDVTIKKNDEVTIKKNDDVTIKQNDDVTIKQNDEVTIKKNDEVTIKQNDNFTNEHMCNYLLNYIQQCTDEYEELKDVSILSLHSKMSLDKKRYTLNCFNGTNLDNEDDEKKKKKKKKKILFATSLLHQGIELNKVNLVIHLGMCKNVDEYILRTNIVTTKYTRGRSLLLLNELEAHYLYILYKNNIPIVAINKNYINLVYKNNLLLQHLLNYKYDMGTHEMENINTDIKHKCDKKVNDTNKNIVDQKNIYHENNCSIQIQTFNNYYYKKDENNFFQYNYHNEKDYKNIFFTFNIKHIEWYKYKHLLSSCELMYRSFLGFYCEKNEFLKYEKWQVPSLIKNIIYSFGYLENFYITKCMAARLQIINAPDTFIKFNATSKSVLISSLPTYKSYKSKTNEFKLKKCANKNSTNINTPNINNYNKHNTNYDYLKDDDPLNDFNLLKPNDENQNMQTHPLYFTFHKYVS